MNSTERELTKPEWHPLDNPAAFNMSPESIGYYLFTEYGYLLGGRLRPTTIFNQPPLSRYHQGLWKEAGRHGLSTMGEILRLAEDELIPPSFSDRFVKGLRDYVEGLALPPHVQLVKVVFGQKHHFTPFPAALEQEFIQTVEEQLDTLSPRQRAVLICRYGLADGIIRNLQQTAAHPAFNLTRERIRQIEAKALRLLRHPSKAEYLERFMPFPEGSLGRAVFGPRLRRYLPLLYERQLSDSIKAELLRYEVSVQPLAAGLKYEATPIQLENIQYLAVLLDCGLYDQQNDQPTPAPAQENNTLTSPDTTEQKQWINNLLSELPITNEQLTAIGRLNLSEVGFPSGIVNTFARYRNQTFGDVLSMTPLKFAKIRTLGKKSAFQFGMKLGELLQLPPDQYRGDYVAKLLENIVRNLKTTTVR